MGFCQNTQNIHQAFLNSTEIPGGEIVYVEINANKWLNGSISLYNLLVPTYRLLNCSSAVPFSKRFSLSFSLGFKSVINLQINIRIWVYTCVTWGNYLSLKLFVNYVCSLANCYFWLPVVSCYTNSFESWIVSFLQEVIMVPLDHKNLDRDVPYFANVVRCVSFSVLRKQFYHKLYVYFFSLFNSLFSLVQQHNWERGCLHLGQHGKGPPTQSAVRDKNLWDR